MVQKLLILIFSVVLLAACGNAPTKEVSNNSETISVYENASALTHNMEGVKLKIDYEVKKITGKVEKLNENSLTPGDFLLEVTGEIRNDFERTIYYTPTFIVQSDSQVQFEEIASSVEVEQLQLEPTTKETFTITYVIPKESYGQFSSLNFVVPAAFSEPNSVSSGDALGDSTTWEIPIK